MRVRWWVCMCPTFAACSCARSAPPFQLHQSQPYHQPRLSAPLTRPLTIPTDRRRQSFHPPAFVTPLCPQLCRDADVVRDARAVVWYDDTRSEAERRFPELFRLQVRTVGGT